MSASKPLRNMLSSTSSVRWGSSTAHASFLADETTHAGHIQSSILFFRSFHLLLAVMQHQPTKAYHCNVTFSKLENWRTLKYLSALNSHTSSLSPLNTSIFTYSNLLSSVRLLSVLAPPSYVFYLILSSI